MKLPLMVALVLATCTALPAYAATDAECTDMWKRADKRRRRSVGCRSRALRRRHAGKREDCPRRRPDKPGKLHRVVPQRRVCAAQEMREGRRVRPFFMQLAWSIYSTARSTNDLD